jgi:AraC-like DNA-binding protein
MPWFLVDKSSNVVIAEHDTAADAVIEANHLEDGTPNISASNYRIYQALSWGTLQQQLNLDAAQLEQQLAMETSTAAIQNFTKRRTQPTRHSITDIKTWRARRAQAGLPSSFEDFLQVHNICRLCKGAGQFTTEFARAHPETIQCPECEGSGKYRPTVAALWHEIQRLRAICARAGLQV